MVKLKVLNYLHLLHILGKLQSWGLEMKPLKPLFGITILLAFVFIGFLALISGCSLEAECTFNSDCSSYEYCAKSIGESNGIGSCEIKPMGCPETLDLVCGNDGNTYTNDCAAAQAGVNVAYEGECGHDYCWDNEMCETGNYCYFSDCDHESGRCQPRPEACITLWDPVCGCDGITYSNDCDAASNGISVDYKGECVQTDGLVCCEAFGYGSNWEKCCETYEWTLPAECTVPEDWVGGGKQIVADSYCLED